MKKKIIIETLVNLNNRLVDQAHERNKSMEPLAKAADLEVEALRKELSNATESMHAKNGIIATLETRLSKINIEHQDLKEQIEYKTKIIQDYNKEREQYENNLKAKEWTIKDQEEKLKTLLETTRAVPFHTPTKDELINFMVDEFGISNVPTQKDFASKIIKFITQQPNNAL